MRILGIDPGLNATGYGVIAVEGATIEVIDAGAVTPPARQPLAQRLLELAQGLRRVIAHTRPDLAVLEAVYTHHEFVTTAALMAHARGVACLVCAQHGLTVVDYLPTRIKKAITGNGHASKEQVARLVGVWLGRRDAAWTADTTDALGVAIAHAHLSRSPLADARVAALVSGRRAGRRRAMPVGMR